MGKFESALYDKAQTKLGADGTPQPNTFKYAIIEAPKLDFNKKATCPFCLAWLPISKFILSTKKGYNMGLGKCPECEQNAKLKTLFGLGTMTPEAYAKFITDYPKPAFWKKCKFEVWKRRLNLMKWGKPLWDEYKKLNPKLDDEPTDAENSQWTDYEKSLEGSGT